MIKIDQMYKTGLFSMKNLKDERVELIVVPYSNVMARCGEGIPGNVEPARAGQELVGEFTGAEEVDKALEGLIEKR